ncbi:protein of unknown function [Streptomyces murinus]
MGSGRSPVVASASCPDVSVMPGIMPRRGRPGHRDFRGPAAGGGETHSLWTTGRRRTEIALT